MSFSAKKYIDIRRRKEVRAGEAGSLAVRALFSSQLLPQEERQSLFNYYVERSKRSASAVRIKNRCLVTNRSKSVIRFFKVSRIVFRERARTGRLLGVRRAAW